MSDSNLSDLEDEPSWILELETALLDNCDFFKLRDICQERSVPKHLRADVWKICLNLNTNTNSEDFQRNFNDLFDLPNQEQLHNSCCQFVASLPKDLFTNSIGLINDIESVLTFFSRKYNIRFNENNGWLAILRVICCELKITNRAEVYAYFTAIAHRFLPSSNVINNEIFSIFRLLIQYHDPELCSLLDTLKINPKNYAYDWFSSLFAADIQLDALVQLWDIYFMVADPFLMFYLSLIVLLNLKETLMEMKQCEKSEVLSTIQSVLRQLTAADVEDFFQLAQHYVTKTPKSFIKLFTSILFGNGNKDNEVEQMLDSLCMPVSVHELLENKSNPLNGAGNTIRYFLIDCRPADQYNSGHLSSAYFLDSSLMISSPTEEFQTSVASLLLTQQQALDSNSDSAGEHICFLGSGDLEEDRVVHMIVAQFLQKMTRYVSLVHGGYRAIHDVLGPQCDTYLVGHSETADCILCSRGHSGKTVSSPRNMSRRTPNNPGTNNAMIEDSSENTPGMSKIIGKFSGMLKKNSSKMKEKLLSTSLASNLGIDITNNQSAHPTKSSSNQKSGSSSNNTKSYRDTGNIFIIDDDDDGDDDDSGENNSGFITSQQKKQQSSPANSSSKEERINLSLRIKNDDFLSQFECFVVYEDGKMVPGCLLLTTSELLVLRQSHGVISAAKDLIQNKQHQSGAGGSLMWLYKKRDLNQVIKITSRKKLPECLSFHYQMPDGGVEKDRYLVTEAGEAAKAIKVQVQKILDEEAAGHS